jgi:hypothetical protein
MGLHHAILDGTVAYGARRAGGLQITETAGGQLRPAGSLTPDAWGGGNTHTTLPLPGRNLVVLADESVQDHQADGRRKIWLLDVADRTAPKVIGALPEPAALDFRAMGGVFGPHNLHENRPGTWRSEDLIFATYQNASVRAYDIADPKAPHEVACCVPPPPARNVDPRASGTLVPQSADLIVSAEGLIIASDLNAGISLIYDGLNRTVTLFAEHGPEGRLQVGSWGASFHLPPAEGTRGYVAGVFLLHNLFRFGVGGVTIEHYVRGIKQHLAPRLSGPG